MRGRSPSGPVKSPGRRGAGPLLVAAAVGLSIAVGAALVARRDARPVVRGVGPPADAAVPAARGVDGGACDPRPAAAPVRGAGWSAAEGPARTVADPRGGRPSGTEDATAAHRGWAAATAAGCGDDGATRRPDPAELLRWRLDELVARANAAVAAERDAGGVAPDLALALVRALGPDADEGALEALEAHPGRVTPDGFDLAAGAWLRRAAAAWAAGDDGAVVSAARRASTLAPDDPAGPLLTALAEERAGRPDAAREAFLAARGRDPGEPALALATGRRLATTARFDDARAALETYLAAHPDDGPIRGLADRLAEREATFAGGRARTLDGVTLVVAPGATPAAGDRALHLALARALEEAAWLTGTDRRPELTVLVHRDRAALRRATCGATWTDALYDGALHLHGEALRDEERGRRTMRHEALHAQLHALPVRWPRWFDEGVAQHFAGEEAGAAADLRVMVENDTWIPFASLEDSFLVIEARADAGLAYHQSLAMVEWLVARRGRGVIAEGVAWLRDGGDPRRLAAALGGDGFDGRALVAWLATRR